jgi:hypothetical protein
MTGALPEDNRSLWALAASPSIWAGHFLLSYATAAIWCAKFAAPGAAASGVRLAIAGYSFAALVGIAIIGWRGWLRHRTSEATSSHERDSAAARHRFLGFATFLLSALSAVAVLYAMLAIVFLKDCR